MGQQSRRQQRPTPAVVAHYSLVCTWYADGLMRTTLWRMDPTSKRMTPVELMTADDPHTSNAQVATYLRMGAALAEATLAPSASSVHVDPQLGLW